MGGLTCALALAKAGFKDIEVYEMASNLGFVGAGIQLAPNMARVLDRLGVWKEIEREAVSLEETSIIRKWVSCPSMHMLTRVCRGLYRQRTRPRRSAVHFERVRLPTYGWPQSVASRSYL